MNNEPTPYLMVVEITLWTEHEKEALLDDIRSDRKVMSAKVISE